MPREYVTPERVAEICARLIRGDTVQSIRIGMACGERTILRARGVLERFGFAIEPRSRPTISPDSKAKMRELFEAAELSNGAIAKVIGCSPTVVHEARHAFNRELVLRGELLPLCRCGEILNHSGDCQARADEKASRRGVDILARAQHRAQARASLLAGENYHVIGRRLGISWCVVRQFCRTLSADDRAQREQSLRVPAARRRAAALAAKIDRPRGTDPRADRLYARALAALAPTVDRSLREESAGDAYMEYLEGRCSADEIEEVARRMLRRNFKRFADKWGDFSLDERRGPDGDWTLGEIIEDPRALEAFDAL